MFHPFFSMSLAIFSTLALVGCAHHPPTIDTSSLAALRLETLDLEKDQIEFSLYNMTQQELEISTNDKYYLGEISVICDGHALVFMEYDVALAHPFTSLGYEDSEPIQTGDRLHWTMLLSQFVRVSTEGDFYTLALRQQRRRKSISDSTSNSSRPTPIFIEEDPLPTPPNLLEYLQTHPNSIVAIQPVYMRVNTSQVNDAQTYQPFRQRSNWMTPSATTEHDEP